MVRVLMAHPLRNVRTTTVQESLVAYAANKRRYGRSDDSQTNLVDPASSHMLVSKVKPCMSQYELLIGETANGSLKQL